MFCSNCGRAVKDGARFCSGCGAKLIPDPGAVQKSAAPAAQPASAPIQQNAAQNNVQPAPQAAPAQPQRSMQSANTPPASPAAANGGARPAQSPVSDPYSYDLPQQQRRGTPYTPYPPAPGPSGRKEHRAAPVGKKTRGHAAAWIVGIAAVLAVCIAAVFLFVLTPKNRVGLAFKRSVGAYSAAAEKLIPFDYAALAEKQAVSQELSVGIRSLPYLNLSRELGLRMRMDTNIPDEYAGVELALTAGSESLLTLRAAADGDFLYAGSPELLDSSYYGFNTMTLGQDISEPSLDLDPSGELGNLSFNVFQLYNDYLKAEPLDPDVTKDFLAAIEVERQGSGKVRVNGNSLSCAEYLVSVPSDAIADYMEAVYDAYTQAADPDHLRSMYLDMGLSEETADKAVSGTESRYDQNSADMQSLLDGLRELDTDLELTVYVSGSYVVGIDYSGSNDFNDYALKIRLGGGKNYVDDLSVELSVDDETAFLLESSGDHMPKNGVFTDETTFEAYDMHGSLSCTYEPDASGDNFTLDAQMGDGYTDLRLNVSGRIESDKKTMNVALGDITLADADGSGEKLTLTLGYVISDFERGFNAKSPVSVFELAQTEINDIQRTITDNLEYISDRIDTLFPGLVRYLF